MDLCLLFVRYSVLRCVWFILNGCCVRRFRTTPFALFIPQSTACSCTCHIIIVTVISTFLILSFRFFRFAVVIVAISFYNLLSICYHVCLHWDFCSIKPDGLAVGDWVTFPTKHSGHFSSYHSRSRVSSRVYRAAITFSIFFLHFLWLYA